MCKVSNLKFLFLIRKVQELFDLFSQEDSITIKNTELKKFIEEFPYMCNSLDDVRWKTEEWFGHMIAMPKGGFMSIHRDHTDDRPFTILNYVNIP